MRSIVVREFGGPDVMRVEEVDIPEPGPGQALVRHEAIGINFIDTYERTGAYPVDVPFVPGREGAGTVEAVGPDVSSVEVGDHVAYAGKQGAYCGLAVVPASKLVSVPSAVDASVAAALMLQGMTAHYLAHDTFRLGGGNTALVHAAAGGVGLLLVQLAKRLGATVIGTVSTAEKEDLARGAGADHVVRYTEVDFLDAVRSITRNKGVDVVYDSVGRDTFTKSLACLRPRGTMVLYGQSSGAVGTIDPQVLNKGGSLFLTRPSLGHYIADRDELLRRSNDLFSAVVAGDLAVRVDRSFDLSEAPDAHRYMEARRTRGKILLTP